MSEEPARSRKAEADLVRVGLHVHKLDRPWVETPFLFQGFRVESDTEVQALREYCDHVYIDLDRSDPEAVKALLAAESIGRASGPAEEQSRPTIETARTIPHLDSPLFNSGPVVDREQLRERVQRAAAARRGLFRSAVDALQAVVSNRSVETNKAHQAVGHMSEIIREDPTASLWLTRLKSDDDYTSRHAVNSSVLALTFGHYLGLEGRALENVGLGTLLMDVGRMIVPGHVFPKPGELSQTEWAYVRRHVTDGVRLLNRSRIPEDALDIVRMHHERALGQGYPEGLVGDRIPWTALIGGLVDSYDAMLHRRPYRDAFQPEEAIGVLYKEAKSTFGEELVESFVWYLGSYPVGTVVELDNGAIGVVVGHCPGAGLWPTVLLVRNADREPFRKRMLLNLAAANRQPETANVPARRIRRALSPDDAQVPVGQIVAQEFGLGETKKGRGKR